MFSVKANIFVTLYPHDQACLFYFQSNGSHYWCHSLLPTLLILNNLNVCRSLPLFATVHRTINHIQKITFLLVILSRNPHALLAESPATAAAANYHPNHRLQGQPRQQSLRSF